MCHAPRSKTRVVLLFTVLLSLPAVVQAQGVAWELYDQSCEPRRRYIGTEMSCGDYGTYWFSNSSNRTATDFRDPNRGLCEPRSQGEGTPFGVTAQPSLDGTSGTDWVPCQYGGCTSAPGGNWVAVIDWDEVHGWSVVETIQQASSPSNIKVWLYDLEQIGLATIDALDAVGDAHLLEQLCALAEEASISPPTVLNLSFGRTGVPQCNQENPIGCEVGAVLSHLRSLGTRIVAAAGNHADLQYPAAFHGVFSVGAVDLETLDSGPQPTPYTPNHIDALFPAYGLVLEQQGGPGLWAAPPGSSYAAALLSGWLARVEATKGNLDFLDDVNTGNPLSFTGDGTGHLLTVGGVPVPYTSAPGASRLIAIALGDIDDPFLGLEGEGTSYSVEPASTTVPGLGNSLAEANLNETRPSPDSEACVPCRLQNRRRRDTFEGPPAVLDLSGAGGVAAGSELDQVYLRVGEQYYDLVTPDSGSMLDALELGTVKEIEFSSFPPIGNNFVSLVYLLTRTSDEQPFWDSTPVTVHYDEGEIFFDGLESSDLSEW